MKDRIPKSIRSTIVYCSNNFSVSPKPEKPKKKQPHQKKKTLTMSESIYDWIEREPEKIVKPPMYHSRHSPKNRLAGSTFRKQNGGHKTFGKDSTKSDPKSFLRSSKNRGVSPKSKRTFLLFISLFFFFFFSKLYY